LSSETKLANGIRYALPAGASVLRRDRPPVSSRSQPSASQLAIEKVIVCETELVIKSRQLKTHDAGLREQFKSTLMFK